jgi:acetyl-CoA carboxylase carboxyl transferase subunit alpha
MANQKDIKALRLMKMAEKFGIPVLTYRYSRCLSRTWSKKVKGPRNIFEMVRLKCLLSPLLLVKELQGALGIGVGDRVYA